MLVEKKFMSVSFQGGTKSNFLKIGGGGTCPPRPPLATALQSGSQFCVGRQLNILSTPAYMINLLMKSTKKTDVGN